MTPLPRDVEGLQARHLALLMASMFAVYLGYGIILPTLPFLVERLLPDAARASIAWHTGMISGLYMLMLFVFAPIWGQVSDRIGRRPVLLVGLAGCVLALMSFGLSTTLWIAYVARAAGGALVSAVVPVALAYVADTTWATQRARRFAWLTAASTLALVLGPGLGGWLTVGEPTGPPSTLSSGGLILPLGVAAAFGAFAWLAVYIGLPESSSRASPDTDQTEGRQGIGLLLSLTLLAFFGLGSFETALTLRAQQILGLAPDELAVLFIECGAVMAAVQLVALPPLLRHVGIRWTLVLALVAMAAGLFWLSSAPALAAAALWVSLTAAAAGITMPLLGYAVSLTVGTAQGHGLGRQTAMGSFGQGLGSAAAGWFFGMAADLPFWITAGLLVAGGLASFGVRRRRRGAQ